jgi:lipid A 4'-phosphatase
MRIPILAALAGTTVFVGAVFAAWPQIDLLTASVFYGRSGFGAAGEPVWEALRRIAYWTPDAVFVAAALLYGARRLGAVAIGPSGRSLLFLAATMALGPGLLINVALKDHSHRPRPIQVSQFGGSDAFKPWYLFDGACAKNCSFASGEVSAAFWTVAPALLTPPWIRGAAIAAALAFGTATALLRLAFGGHFLSDAVLAALFTLIIVFAAAQWFGLGARVRDESDSNAELARLRERRRSL